MCLVSLSVWLIFESGGPKSWLGFLGPKAPGLLVTLGAQKGYLLGEWSPEGVASLPREGASLTPTPLLGRGYPDVCGPQKGPV